MCKNSPPFVIVSVVNMGNHSLSSFRHAFSLKLVDFLLVDPSWLSRVFSPLFSVSPSPPPARVSFPKYPVVMFWWDCGDLEFGAYLPFSKEQFGEYCYYFMYLYFKKRRNLTRNSWQKLYQCTKNCKWFLVLIKFSIFFLM